MIKVRVYRVGDAGPYGIEFGGWYAWNLVKLVNKQLMSEGKATIKSADSNWKFNDRLDKGYGDE